ncbi:hypothetical protein HDU87_005545 [Geranomyces variabilis]|uniref:Uncharacterized protein n=1 Tax=Geranomyces variabilis TaxID=109894 RepID=A0AAD5XPM9_9FUNG|nr:hypothetical protein HDU87_005545 [Geranomyces variabilis]
MCFSHLVQRVSMMFYLDSTLSRNCTALVVIGNLFGEVLFRFCLLWMLNSLYRSMRANDIRAKATTGLSMALYVASSILFMQHLISAPITDQSICGQALTQWKTTVNNLLFLTAYLAVALPMVHSLYNAFAMSKTALNSGPYLIASIYERQLVFLTTFTCLFVLLIVVQWFIAEWSWLLLDFIAGDYIWLQGIAIWTSKSLAPEPGPERQTQVDGSRETRPPPKTMLTRSGEAVGFSMLRTADEAAAFSVIDIIPN